jgi:O-antigen/teichoic acid export membrane protein
MTRDLSSVGRKLVSGSALRVVNLVGAAVASFLLMPFIVHRLGDRIYGFWSLAAAFIGYYNLLDLGLSSAVSQYMCAAIGSKDSAECRAVFNTALRLQFLIGGSALLVTCAIAAATPWICHNPGDVHLFWRVIAILGINAALGFPVRVYWAVLEAELRFDIQSWLANLGLVVRTGLIIWAISAGGGLLALAWVALLATLPVTALQVWFARRQASWARIDNRFVQWKRVRNFFSYSVYSFLAYIADIVRFQIDPVVISGMIGLAAVTHYKVAGVLAQYYLQIIVVSVGMLLPVLSRLHGAGNRTALEGVFFFGTKLSCCISVFICLALVGWGKPFIARWMGPSYQDGYIPLVVLAFAVLLDVSQKSSADLLFATFKHRFYAGINCTEAALNLALSLAFARPFGILGVAMGTLVGAFAIRVVVQPWWVCRVSGLDYASYMKFLGGNLLRCGCLASVAIAIAAWGLRPNYFWLAVSAVCATGFYAAGSWLVVFNQAERAQLLRALRGNGKKNQSELPANA